MSTVSVSIHCEAPDDELLLTDWLNALVCKMAARHLLFRRFRVVLDGHRLDAEVQGDPAFVARQ